MNEKEIKELKAARGTIKAQLTRFKNFLEDITQAQFGQVPDRLLKCEELWEKFDDIQIKLEIEDEEQVNERSNFEDVYFYSVARAKGLMESSRISSVSEAESRVSQTNTAANINVPTIEANSHALQAQTNTGANIKLPTIELPYFNGAYDQWVTFHDTFKSLIHTNSSLNCVQKFYYLKSCLKGDAGEVLRSLEVTEVNYDVAWDLLKERFENKRLTIHNHLKALFDFQPIEKESLQATQKLLDDLRKHLRALKALGQPTDQWDTIIIHMITAKLDYTSKREWEKLNVTSALPSMSDFYSFLGERCQLLETLKNGQQTNKSQFNKDKKDSNKASATGYRALVTTMKCYFCSEAHGIYSCERFLKLDARSRLKEAEKLNLCQNCLRSGHTKAECSSRGCKHCQKRHNSLLHFNTKEQTQECPVTATPCTQQFAKTLLPTALVYVMDSNKKLHESKVLLDSASQANFISTEFCNQLKLPKQKISTPIIGISKSVTAASYVTNATIKSRVNNFQTDASFIVIDQITGDLPTSESSMNSINLPDNIILADPNFNTPGAVNMLLGASIFWDLLCMGQLRSSPEQPIIQKTKLGWIVTGNTPNDHVKGEMYSNKFLSCNLSTTANIQNQLEGFWKIEEGDQKEVKWSREEQECEDIYQKTTTRDENGHFSVELPMKEGISDIGDTYEMASQRLFQLERKLAKNERLRQLYINFIDEYEDMGHMTNISNIPDAQKSRYYLPHHGVYKEDSATTKLRVVFDASAKSSTGLSLNDKLMVGPTIQEDLFAIVVRFRSHNYVLAADIAKMYRMVWLKESQRHLQCILWRKSDQEPIQVYQLNTVTYGTAPAAFLAIRCLQQVGIECKETYPHASKAILSDFYVDDCLTGADSISEAKRLKQDLAKILDQYGFSLRKWMSNDPEILSDVSSNPEVAHFIAEDKMTRTLGLFWNPRADTLSYHVDLNKPNNNKVTKRTILSTTSQLFDPLGLVGPCIVKAKLIIQKLWQLGLQWDETVPYEIHTNWTHFHKQLEKLNEVTLQRHAFCMSPKNTQLHCFSDASEVAYGACIYARTTDSENRHFSRLLCAKSRVAPLKRITLPRLELCGAVLMSQLAERVQETLSERVNETFYYTDSSIVLAWIKTEPNQLKTFVSNRVAEIQRITNIHSWHHVKGKENPADILSRGADPEQLLHCQLWWQGPSWLCSDEEEWRVTSTLEMSNDLPERRKVHSYHVTAQSNLFGKYSTLKVLQRVTAYCSRFISNSMRQKQFRITGALTLEELEGSLKKLVKAAQAEEFEEEIKSLERNKPIDSRSKLLSLNPFLDKEGLLRVGGRLKNAALAYDNCHQMILPKGHNLTKLIIQQEHRKQLHAGPQTLLGLIRLRFWPISGRNAVREIFRKCLVCFRTRPISYQHLMGDLPKHRITPATPFNICGIDFAGPFNTKTNKLRNRKIVKSYMCLFVCFVSKAVHIELVSDLSTESFLNGLKRFISRRGKCSRIYSDNGTNFVGANNKLREVSDFFRNADNKNKIADYASQDGIEWHFIPPRSPHFGGLWESAIKGAKTHLSRVIGDTALTFEELYTVLTQVEAVLNSRPLTPLTETPTDLNALTPGHFLIGKPLCALPQHELLDEKCSRLTRYQHLTQIVQHFWQRWSMEYLSNLQQRGKWKVKNNISARPGAMVLLKDEHLPPLKWQLGRIEKVISGSDGVVRVAEVKTERGVLKRAIAKLCPLPFENN